MRTRALLGFMALGWVIAACVWHHHPAAPHPAPQQAPSVVLPWQQTPDNACHPKTLADMFIPCDTKDQP